MGFQAVIILSTLAALSVWVKRIKWYVFYDLVLRPLFSSSRFFFAGPTSRPALSVRLIAVLH